jgi:hypothetical protein
MIFFVQISATQHVLVSADRWVDARHWARVRYGQYFVVRRCEGTPSVELRLVGQDAGRVPTLHMEAREGAGEWVRV